MRVFNSRVCGGGQLVVLVDSVHHALLQAVHLGLTATHRHIDVAYDQTNAAYSQTQTHQHTDMSYDQTNAAYNHTHMHQHTYMS